MNLPPLIGMLASLPNHIQDCIREYAGAAVRMSAQSIPCGRPAKKLCQGGQECWCKRGEPSEMEMEAKARKDHTFSQQTPPKDGKC